MSLAEFIVYNKTGEILDLLLDLDDAVLQEEIIDHCHVHAAAGNA